MDGIGYIFIALGVIGLLFLLGLGVLRVSGVRLQRWKPNDEQVAAELAARRQYFRTEANPPNLRRVNYWRYLGLMVSNEPRQPAQQLANEDLGINTQGATP